jgi:hypothetical protein
MMTQSTTWLGRTLSSPCTQRTDDALYVVIVVAVVVVVVIIVVIVIVIIVGQDQQQGQRVYPVIPAQDEGGPRADGTRPPGLQLQWTHGLPLWHGVEGLSLDMPCG